MTYLGTTVAMVDADCDSDNVNDTVGLYLQKLYSQFWFCEDIHASEVANHTQARRKLDTGPQLLYQLVQHQLATRFHFVHYIL